MNISIVFAYYNRRNVLINTLTSITKTKYVGELELIIVNDGSSFEHNLDDINDLFPLLNIKVINIKKEKKWWINPCIPNNIGIHFTKGDIIILQNPECFHVGDIIKHVSDHIDNNKYIVFGSYAIDNVKTTQINNSDSNMFNYFEDIKGIISPMNNIPTFRCYSRNKWYQHSKFHPTAFNFCAAITKNDLNDLGWFDERYAGGIAKDDKEFLLRVRRKDMEIQLIDDPFVIHQWHTYFNYNNKVLFDKNTKLYEDLEKGDGYKVNNKLINELVETVIY
ncbi:glycosyltransferase [candidate division WOR-3 bacterium]|nr:glycosyltransferase [Candidatus Parcubacteria bacterium]MCK4528472.1 glycosyltransferase [candidate division WOR-3 bacterium]